MSPTDKQKFKAQLMGLSAQVQASRSLMTAAIPPTPPMPAMTPIPLTPSLTPLQSALRTQSEMLEKLLKVLGDVIEAS
jgi:aspartyl/asparaginyl beta-hydroxylase (cupin superfamily)